MNRRHFISRAAALSIASFPGAAFKVAADPASKSASLVHSYRSPIKERYDLTRERVIHGTYPAYTPDFLMEGIVNSGKRRFTEFSGDLSGRWIEALSAATMEFGDHFPELDGFVARVVAHQHPQGYFGKSFNAENPDDNDLALLWGNGRLLVGLMEYHALTGDPQVLQSATRLGEFLLGIAPAFNSQKMAEEFGASHFASSYICWTQQTEGLAALYAATHDNRFRVLCEAISERMVRRPGDHVHGYLCSLRGALDLYFKTRDPAMLKRVEDAWTEINHSGDILLTGGVPEAWSPKKLRTEGCAECDWLRLNLALWRATQDPKYIEAAELVYFNDFSQNQFSTGDFGHAELNSLGVPGIVAIKAWWCCTLHGMRAFSYLRPHVFLSSGNDVAYGLALDGRLKTDALDLVAYSDLAYNGTARILVAQAAKGQTLTVRQPRWADAVSVKINGIRRANGLTVPIVSGDHVEIEYSFVARRVQAGAEAPLSERSAFFVGPWLLGCSSLTNVHYFNELQADNLVDRHLAAATVASIHSPFAVPIAARSISYLPAEYVVQPGRAELRAIAEQTASPPARWEMAFLNLPSRS